MTSHGSSGREMQSVSPSLPTRVIQRTRDALPGGVLWTSLLVFFLTLAVSKSTVTAEWVGGIEVVPLVALAGALVLGSPSLAPRPGGVWGSGGPAPATAVAGLAASPGPPAAHPRRAPRLDTPQ